MKGDFLRPWLVAVVKLAHIVLQSDPSAPFVTHGILRLKTHLSGATREPAET